VFLLRGENIMSLFSLFGPPNIEKLEAKRNVQGLIKALSYEKDWQVQRNAAAALGQIGDARAVEPLSAALKDSNWIVRQNAAEALGKIGDARAVEPLIAVLKDRVKDVWQSAAAALEKIGWQPTDGNQRALRAVALREWDLAVREGPAAVEPLIAAIKD
jgi:HEAT repeat protein